MYPPAGGEWCSEPWRNRPFRREAFFYAVNCSANAARGVYNDVIIMARCQSFRIVWISVATTLRLLGLGTACRSRALQLERNMTVQYL